MSRSNWDPIGRRLLEEDDGIRSICSCPTGVAPRLRCSNTIDTWLFAKIVDAYPRPNRSSQVEKLVSGKCGIIRIVIEHNGARLYSSSLFFFFFFFFSSCYTLSTQGPGGAPIVQLHRHHSEAA